MNKAEKSVPGIGEDAYTFLGGIIFRKGKAKANVMASAYHGSEPKDEVVKYLAGKVTADL